MIRIDAIWLALGASDLRGGIDSLLAQVLRGFGQGVQPHHAYIFANRRATRLKVLVLGGVGLWLCLRRLQAGSFAWPREGDQNHSEVGSRKRPLAHTRTTRLAGGGPALAAPEPGATQSHHHPLRRAAIGRSDGAGLKGACL